jgi:HD-like signal output (HDOD) protein
VAGLAKRIAEVEGSSKEIINASYQAGFLHDIGTLVLAANLPREYAKAGLVSGATDAIRIAQERAAFGGASHAEVGGYLLGIWGLPDLVTQAVTFHHEPSRFRTVGFSPLLAVHVANAMERGFSTGSSLPANDLQDLDHEYVRASGLSGRLESWETACRQMLEEGVAS